VQSFSAITDRSIPKKLAIISGTVGLVSLSLLVLSRPKFANGVPAYTLFTCRIKIAVEKREQGISNA